MPCESTQATGKTTRRDFSQTGHLSERGSKADTSWLGDSLCPVLEDNNGPKYGVLRWQDIKNLASPSTPGQDCTGVGQQLVQLSWAGAESEEQPQPRSWTPGSAAGQAGAMTSQGARDYRE